MMGPRHMLYNIRGACFVLLLLSLLGIYPCPAAAATRFRHITMEDGLSANLAFTVIQDRHGYMWITTENGLDRYDGYNFKIYKHNPNEPGSPSGIMARALHEDSAGRLWLGTFTNGLDLFDPVTGTFRQYRHLSGDSNSISSDAIWTLNSTADGKLIIGTYDAGIDVLDTRTGKITHHPAHSGPTAASDNRINNIFIDHERRVWLSTGSGLDEFDPNGILPTRHLNVCGDKCRLFYLGRCGRQPSPPLVSNVTGAVCIFPRPTCSRTGRIYQRRPCSTRSLVLACGDDRQQG